MKWAGTAAVLTGIALLSSAHAADLSTDTLQAFDEYVARAKARTDASGATGFLWVDSSPASLHRVRDGAIVAAPVGHTPLKVPGGLIHDWIGAEFIPNTTTADVLAMVHDYGRYRDFYAPLVIDSKTLAHDGDDYRFRLLMMNRALFSKSALDGDYVESFVTLQNQRCYSFAHSTSIRQIDHYGEPNENLLPDGEGSGYIWRLFSISKFEQRDGGVYVELEVIALSRGIPASLHWLVDPIVRRVAKGSLLTSLDKTRAAVNSATARTHEPVPLGTPLPAVSSYR